MKQFTRIEPTTTQEVGDKFKRQAVIKRFRTDDELEHEFTTFYSEDNRSVAVIALTTNNGVIVVNQFRPNQERYFQDIPGGGVEPGESFESAARRELFEETGYETNQLTDLGEWTWDAYSNGVTRYFFAKDCVKRQAEREYDHLEVDQGAYQEIISVKQLIDNAKHNNMTDAVAVLYAYDELCVLASKDVTEIN